MATAVAVGCADYGDSAGGAAYLLAAVSRLSRGTIGIALLLAWACKSEKPRWAESRAAQYMQEFVEELSVWARSRKPGFILLPQNGPELAFEAADPTQPLRWSYLNAIDGFTAEEVFYEADTGDTLPSPARLEVLRRLRAYKPIFCSEYVRDSARIPAAYARIYQEGFIGFVRSPNNYYYQELPDTVPMLNEDSIPSLGAARNFLYLLNPDLFPSREAYITALAQSKFDVLVIDAQYQGAWLSEEEVRRLHYKPSGKRRLVLAYINIGAAERWRFYWQPGWRLGSPSWLRKPYPGYPDEFYVAYWEEVWKQILFKGEGSYMSHILAAGFDGAFLDNVEAYYYLTH
ncbi:MAG: endo alpha-1,4 polygalactosaminidase [Bacteroidia bacterium]|nr:endo alpha-1,4 polygalactosaminidase [Bacteroidia bacterium]